MSISLVAFLDIFLLDLAPIVVSVDFGVAGKEGTSSRFFDLFSDRGGNLGPKKVGCQGLRLSRLRLALTFRGGV